MPKRQKVAPRYIFPGTSIDSSFLKGFDDPSLCTFRDAGLVEVGRGCSRGCRFCAAGHIYLPVRHRSPADIFRDVETYRGKADRIGLVGASLSDYRYLKKIVKGILDRGYGLTTSSFRADMLDSNLVSMLREGGLQTITIAPEGGSERMREIINKHLKEEEILNAVSACRQAGIKRMRLYYMVGLPWERTSDIDAIPTLTGEIMKAFGSPGNRITVSVNPFIPKPQTPFQWCSVAELPYIKDVYQRLARAFRGMKGVTLKTLSARVALREAVISLGDEHVGYALVENARDGIPWKKALVRNGVDQGKLVHMTKSLDTIFPWDEATGGDVKAALLDSFRKARETAEKR